MISLGLVGYPLDFSLSPVIHTAAMKYCGFEGNYALFPVAPDDLNELKELLDRVRKGRMTGLNITIPHKQKVLPLLNELTQVAQAIGAVNTIFMRNGELIGDNTDAQGFIADLHKYIPVKFGEREKGQKALVIGAGGAARAVVYGLVNESWKVMVTARSSEKTKALIAQFPDHASCLTGIEYDRHGFQAEISSMRLVINATPVGMTPDVENSPWPAGEPHPKNAIFYDLVYKPRETKFVQDARASGLVAFNGLGMLVEQAALAFKIWTGSDVPRELLLASLEEK
jgi:shikimate dehydrogenase